MTAHRDHQDEVWGDDPEERDASAVVEQLPLVSPEAERRWHDHPAFVPFKAVGMFVRRSGKRIAITVIGALLLIIAVAIIPVPGPWSILLAIVALSILASEYVWAERLLKRAKEKAEQAKNLVMRKKDDAPSDDSAA
jgi:Flp pilus assembly protein TadB